MSTSVVRFSRISGQCRYNGAALLGGFLPSVLRRMLFSLALLAFGAPETLYADDAPEAGEPPAWVANASTAEPFQSLWAALLADAGIKVRFNAVPISRQRRAFIEGEAVLDCCIIPAWRTKPEEIAVQLFTDPMFPSRNHYVVRRGDDRDFDRADVRALSDQVVIRGLAYTEDHVGGFRSLYPVADWPTLLRAIALGRADVGIINEHVYVRTVGTQADKLMLGVVQEKLSLRARVHKDNADLLPLLNAAIARFQKEGRFERYLMRNHGPSQLDHSLDRHAPTSN